jgi:hypothetical protein
MESGVVVVRRRLMGDFVGWRRRETVNRNQDIIVSGPHPLNPSSLEAEFYR